MNPIIVQHIKNFLHRASPRIHHSRDDSILHYTTFNLNDFISQELSQFFSKIDCYILVLGNTLNCSQCSNTLSIDWKVCRCSAPLCKTCIECNENCNENCDENCDEDWDDWEEDKVDRMARDDYLFGYN